MAVDSTVLAQYNGGDLKITAILFLVLTGLSVGLRTYVRAFMTNSFQADDWLMLIAQVRFIPLQVFSHVTRPAHANNWACRQTLSHLALSY